VFPTKKEKVRMCMIADILRNACFEITHEFERSSADYDERQYRAIENPMGLMAALGINLEADSDPRTSAGILQVIGDLDLTGPMQHACAEEVAERLRDLEAN
jgi:hypothetical protein